MVLSGFTIFDFFNIVMDTKHCHSLFRTGETCSHVGAMLYKLEAAERCGFTRPTPTELPCKWNEMFDNEILLVQEWQT